MLEKKTLARYANSNVVQMLYNKKQEMIRKIIYIILIERAEIVRSSWKFVVNSVTNCKDRSSVMLNIRIPSIIYVCMMFFCTPTLFHFGCCGKKDFDAIGSAVQWLMHNSW